MSRSFRYEVTSHASGLVSISDNVRCACDWNAHFAPLDIAAQFLRAPLSDITAAAERGFYATTTIEADHFFLARGRNVTVAVMEDVMTGLLRMYSGKEPELQDPNQITRVLMQISRTNAVSLRRPDGAS